MLLRAALPLPAPYAASWPWSMFDRRTAWEKHLEAIGHTADARAEPIPLHELFTYSRGETRLRAYDQLKSLGKPDADEERGQLARFLNQRMLERGESYPVIELRFRRRHVIEKTERLAPLGYYDTATGLRVDGASDGARSGSAPGSLTGLPASGESSPEPTLREVNLE